MKLRNLFLYLYLSIFLVACQKSCKQEDTENILTIGTNATYVPFESVNDKGELEGFDIDLGRAIGDLLEKKVVFKELDFDALVLGLEKEQIDLILSGLSITPSRQKEIAMVPYLGEPITSVSLLFWNQAPKINNFAVLKTLSDRKKLPINVQAGHFLEGFLKKENIPVKPLSNPPEQVLDIKYNKSMAAAVDPSNANKLAKLHKELKIIYINLPEDQWDLGYGAGIKKSRSELIMQVKQAIETLKENGTINKLEQKWLKDKVQ